MSETNEQKMDSLSISTLTVGDLKSLIRDIIKEEFSKLDFREIRYVPNFPQEDNFAPPWWKQPYYHETQPWQQQVWCSSKATGNMNEHGVIE